MQVLRVDNFAQRMSARMKSPKQNREIWAKVLLARNPPCASFPTSPDQLFPEFWLKTRDAQTIQRALHLESSIKRGLAWSRSFLIQRSSALADFLELHFKATKLLGA